jgi:hypothetical protein
LNFRISGLYLPPSPKGEHQFESLQAVSFVIPLQGIGAKAKIQNASIWFQHLADLSDFYRVDFNLISCRQPQKQH